MKKALGVIFLTYFLSSAASVSFAAPFLWSNHITRADFVGGAAVYDAADFRHLYLDVESDDIVTEEHVGATGTLTIAGGDYTYGIESGSTWEKISGSSMTFSVSTDMTPGGDYLFYFPADGQGNRINFYHDAETGLNGQMVTWDFPILSEINGSASIPNFRSTAEQLENYVPYIELVRSDSNVTGIKYRIVNPNNTSSALSMNFDSRVQACVYYGSGSWVRSNWLPFPVNTTVDGTWTLDSPIPESEIYMIYLRFRFVHGNMSTGCYTWRFHSRTESDAGVSDFGTLSNQTPLTVTRGKTASVTITMADGFEVSSLSNKVIIGDTAILSASMEKSGDTGIISLKGLKAGKTTLSFIYYDAANAYAPRYKTVAREVRVTDEDGDEDGNTPRGSSGGGCNAGFFALSLVAVCGLITKRIK